MEAFGILKHQGNDRVDISIDLTSRRLNITRKENLWESRSKELQWIGIDTLNNLRTINDTSKEPHPLKL